jgi:hypothetical protein
MATTDDIDSEVVKATLKESGLMTWYAECLAVFLVVGSQRSQDCFRKVAERQRHWISVLTARQAHTALVLCHQLPEDSAGRTLDGLAFAYNQWRL